MWAIMYLLFWTKPSNFLIRRSQYEFFWLAIVVDSRTLSILLLTSNAKAIMHRKLQNIVKKFVFSWLKLDFTIGWIFLFFYLIMNHVRSFCFQKLKSLLEKCTTFRFPNVHFIRSFYRIARDPWNDLRYWATEVKYFADQGIKSVEASRTQPLICLSHSYFIFGALS